MYNDHQKQVFLFCVYDKDTVHKKRVICHNTHFPKLLPTNYKKWFENNNSIDFSKY